MASLPDSSAADLLHDVAQEVARSVAAVTAKLHAHDICPTRTNARETRPQGYKQLPPSLHDTPSPSDHVTGVVRAQSIVSFIFETDRLTLCNDGHGGWLRPCGIRCWATFASLMQWRTPSCRFTRTRFRNTLPRTSQSCAEHWTPLDFLTSLN